MTNASNLYDPAAYFQKKIALLKKLEALGDDQRRALASASMDVLQSLLLKKDALTQEIDRMDRCAAPLYGSLPQQEKADYEPLVREIRAVLERLVEMENACMEIARNEKDRLHQEIRQNRLGSRAIKSYAPQGPPHSSRFLDLKHG